MAEFIPPQEEVGGRADHLPNVAAILAVLLLKEFSPEQVIESAPPASLEMEVERASLKICYVCFAWTTDLRSRCTTISPTEDSGLKRWPTTGI